MSPLSRFFASAAPQASHFEGDIILTYDQESVMEALANVRTSGTGSPQPAVITVMSRRWSDGIIPYVIDSATGLSKQMIISNLLLIIY